MSGNDDDQQKLRQVFCYLIIFSLLSSDIPLDFYELIWVVPLKYLMSFIASIYAK